MVDEFKAGSTETPVMLADTDLTNKFSGLKEKYQAYENIKVFNHEDFQNYIIENYSLAAIAAAAATGVPASHQ